MATPGIGVCVSGGSDSVFSLIADYARSHGIKRWHVLQIRTTGSLAWLVFEEHKREPVLVAKCSRTPEGAVALQCEVSALARLRSAGYIDGIPATLLGVERPDGTFFHLQTAMPGQPFRTGIDPDARSQIERQFNCILPWIQAFQQRVTVEGTLADSIDRVVSLCRSRLPSLTPAEQELLRAAEALRAEVQGVPAVAVHGDLWAGNVLQHKGRISVLDWGGFHPGAPTEDLHTYATASVSRYSQKTEEQVERLWDVFFGQSAIARLTLAATCGMLHGTNHRLIKAGFTLFLLGRLAMVESTDHGAWQRLVKRLVSTGIPTPWSRV